MKYLPLIKPLFQMFSAFAQMHSYAVWVDKLHKAGDKEAEKQAMQKSAHDWGEKLIKDYKINLVVKNEENIPTEGGVLYICNHQSYMDIVTIYSVLKTQAGFVAKREFEKIPVFAKWIKRLNGLFITRGSAREGIKSIREAAEKLKDGYSIIIFPEGTRSKSNKIGQMKPGSFKVATMAKAPIVPVTIDGAYKVFEETGKLMHNQTVTLTFHEKIETKDMKRDEILELPKKVEDIIRSGMAVKE